MKKFLAILFVILLVAPAAVRVMELDFGMNINRLGLKFPQPFGGALLEKEYYRAVDQYFNDSLPIRAPLILAKNWIDFNIFHTTEADEVHIGRLGWLYSRKSITDYRQTDDIADADMERLVLHLHAIEKIVAAAGRHFLFVVAPSKTAVYPEFVGWSPDFITSGRSPYDRFLHLLDQYPLISHVRLDLAMKAAKRRQALLYDRTHVYWNGIGASVAAESIHGRIREHLASPVVLDYVSTTDGRVGDLGARIMGLESQIADIAYQRLAGSGQADFPSALFYGDGYQHNLTPYLLQMFQQLDVIQADRIPSTQYREDWLDFDCILLEIAQIRLRGLHIDLDRIYDMLIPQSQFLRRTPLDLNKARPIIRTTVRHLSDGLEIKSLGTGSALELPDVPASNKKIFRVVRLTLAVHQSDRMRFQYDLPLRKAAVKSVRPGNLDFYLPLPFQKSVTLRIFPGEKAGLIYLRSAEAIEFSNQPEPVDQTGNTLAAAGPFTAAFNSNSSPSKNNAADAGYESGKNRAAIASDQPDHDSVGKPEPVLSTEPELRPAPHPAAMAEGRLPEDSESQLGYPLVGDAESEQPSSAEDQHDHLLIVDAEIELLPEAEVLSGYPEADKDPPGFSENREFPTDSNLLANTEPALPSDSDDLSYVDTAAADEAEIVNAPELSDNDDPITEMGFDSRHKPESLPELAPDQSNNPDPSNNLDFPSDVDRAADADSKLSESHERPTDAEMPVKSDPELSNVTEIPPEHIRISENRILPDSHRQQAAAPIANLTPSERPLTETHSVAVTEATAGVSQPDKGAAKTEGFKDGYNANSIVMANVGKAITEPPSIKLTDFEDGRIFQRRNGHANIVVSGTFTGPADTIEARVVGTNGLEEIVPWTVIDDSPQNGIFVGVLSGVPQGGWYHLQVRLGNAISVFDRGSHKWGVGILVACLGQSNMKEWFHTGESFEAHALIRKYSESGWTEPGTKGNGASAFGNRLVQSLGIPVGLLDYAVNGSGLRKEADWGTGYWEDTSPDSIYSRFVAGVSRIGGALEFVIWFQGEADAARKTVTETEYRDSLANFVLNQIRSDIANASDREHLPFLIIMLTKRPGGLDEPHQAIRNAQKQVAENVAECYLAAATLDLKNRGKQHMHPKAYTAIGYRVAQTVLYILGKVQYFRGPTVTAVKKINDRRIDVSIDHWGGKDFKPASGISGWEILVNEEPRSIAEVRRRDSATISIILENPLIERATVRYLHGAMPDARRPVVDNSTLALPLEPFQAQVP